MVVGLPGIGIGGLFYMLLVIWMSVREVWLTVRGRSSPRRRRLIGVQVSLAAGIVAALWAEAWLLNRLLASLKEWAIGIASVEAVLHRIGTYGAEFVPPALVLAPFIVLSALVLTLHLLRLLVRRRLPTGG